ncbi:MAG: type II 3-dehydroquinate dehydratase [Elusimicrobiota bacterium]|jgi:3-dehydroquinate dehydratase-2
MKVLVIHGPNLNLLGERRPDVYGRRTLKELDRELRAKARSLKLTLRILQSNHEGRILDVLAAARRWADRLVINPGALTHYSYALRDGIEACGIPAVEVHLSDIRRREPFRRRSVVRAVCRKSFSGGGFGSYLKALEWCAKSAA